MAVQEDIMKEKGRFIVIEGTDGSGKGTQLELLKKKVHELKVPYQSIDFPRYEDNEYGRLVGRYLKGEFGGLGTISPYLISLPYASDRLLARPIIENWLNEGYLVIANRYLHSNVAYSIANMPADQKDKFIKWNYNLEYNTNSIPREDLVVLLYADPETAQRKVDEKGSRSYLGGKGRDIHEENLEYQIKVADAYLYLADSQRHWTVVRCTAEKQMRSREEIHEEIMEVLFNKGIVKK